MKKRKGLTLIEVVVSLMILSLTLVLFAMTLKHFYKSKMLRQEEDEANRIIYAIEEEIKFNYSYVFIKAKLQPEVKLKKYQGFLNELAQNDLFAMENGSDISIKRLDTLDDNKLLIKIAVRSERNEIELKEEKEFIKDNQMYENYEK